MLARHLRGIQRHHAARQREDVQVIQKHEREQKFIPRNHEHIQRHRGQRRQRQRQGDFGDDLRARQSVHQTGLLQLRGQAAKITLQHVQRDRNGGGRINHHQTDERVAQAELAEHRIQRNDQYNRRHHVDEQNRPRQKRAARKTQPRHRVRARHRERQSDQHRDDRHDGRVGEESTKMKLGEQFDIRPKQHGEVPAEVDGKIQRVGEQRLLTLQTGHHHHIKRQRDEHAEQHQRQAFQQTQEQYFN